MLLRRRYCDNTFIIYHYLPLRFTREERRPCFASRGRYFLQRFFASPSYLVAFIVAAYQHRQVRRYLQLLTPHIELLSFIGTPRLNNALCHHFYIAISSIVIYFAWRYM